MRKLLFVPMGAEIKQQSETVPVEKAVAVLRSKKRRRITAAVRHGDDMVTITRHVWRCPYCGGERPAYYRGLRDLYHLEETKPVYDRAVLEEWASPQTSLFEKSNVFRANEPILNPRGTVKCPHCHWYVSDFRGYHIVEMAVTDHKFVLTVALSEEETKELQGKYHFTVTPLMETLTFDLYNHTVTVEWSDGVNRQTSHAWSQASATAFLLNNYIVLKRHLKRMLMKKWNGRPLPFHEEEFTVDTFALMTCHSGWRREFYDALPFEGALFEMEESFKSRLKELTCPSRALALLRKSALPKTTKLRYQFAVKNQGLLLYLPECEQLWTWMEGDVDCFCDALGMDHVFDLLSVLHNQTERLVSLPFRNADADLPQDCVVDGYFFHRIRNHRELLAMDKEMLMTTETLPVMPPLYAVYQNGNPVALLRLRVCRTITAVTGQYGGSVEDPYFWFAFDHWRVRFRMRYTPPPTPVSSIGARV